jgi:hypothetical protein
MPPCGHAGLSDRAAYQAVIFKLSGPRVGSRFEITDIPFGDGTNYDQWKYVSRIAAEHLVKIAPESWELQGERSMSTTSTIDQINQETMQHAPVVLGTILAVENAVGSALPGDTKAMIVITSVLAGAQAAVTSPNVTVSSIAQLTALFVSILNATGIFKHGAKPK